MKTALDPAQIDRQLCPHSGRPSGAYDVLTRMSALGKRHARLNVCHGPVVDCTENPNA